MATQVKRWDMVTGPSREELFDALRLRHEKRRIEFDCVSPGEPCRSVAFLVNGIQIEDGSGHSWNLELYHPNAENGLMFGHFKAYFHTVNRKGVLTQVG